MIVKNLRLKNYRNYSEQTFTYGDGLNIVCGKNAQGKTNSAEAIFMLCTGYSPRVKKDKQVIKYGEESAEIVASAVSNFGTVKVEMRFYNSSRKKVLINDVAIYKIGELMGNINSVFFNPNELKLIQESPEDRRRFMDISLSQMNKRYFYALKTYNDVLAHRNSLLKDENRNLILDTVRLWDEQLIDSAVTIIRERNQFISKLSPYASEVHAYLSGGEILTVDKIKTYGETDKEIRDFLRNALIERLDRDIILGYTTIGPHRDDLKITLNGEDIKVFASQGQQRTAAISLKIAELEIFKDRFGEYPLLILDDALSELDKTRQRQLLKRIDGVQTIITCAYVDEEVFGGLDYKKFMIEGGKIV